MHAAELIADAGPLTGSRFPLEEGRTVLLGRGDEMDIRLLDLLVTEAHCSVAVQGSAAEVTDLGSATGTFVNDRRVQTHRLESGDVLTVGSSRLRFRREAAASPRREPEGSLPSCLDGDSDGSGTVLLDSRGWKGVRRRFNESAIAAPPPEAATGDTGRLRQRLAAICQLANTVHGWTDRDRILNVVAETVLSISGAHRGAVLLRDADGGELRTVATRTRSESVGRDGFTPSRTILDEVTEKGYSVLTSDALADARFRNGASVVMQDIRKVMCVPMKADDRVLGAIYVEGCSVGEGFTEADLSLLAAVGYQAGLAVDRVQVLHDLEELFFGTLETLVAAIEAKDPYLGGHARNVGEFAERMGRELGLTQHDLTVLRLASTLHDVGKIGVSQAILTKRGPLDEAERAAIERHPEAGARIVSQMPRIERLVDVDRITAAILHHHERWDGRGYPAGLAGEDIPFLARILAVADTFDAVTHERTYHAPRSQKEGIALLREVAGTQLDPDLVATFVRLWSRGMMKDPDHGGALTLTGAA